MRAGRTAALAIVAGLAAVALAACASPTQPPPPVPNEHQLESLMSVWPGYEAARINSNAPAALEAVSFEAFVPDDRWTSVMTSCTAEYGVTDITYHSDHTSTAEPTTTARQWGRDFANGACTIRFPPASVKKRLKTVAQLDYIYGYYANDLVPCMASEGFVVKGMPDRARFKVISRNGLTLWSPYASLEVDHARVRSFVASDGLAQVPVPDTIRDPRLIALLAKCPALPPGV